MNANISFKEVKGKDKGEVFTIIGPNGAGKTTSLEMIEGMQKPDKGSVIIDGLTWEKDSDAIKIKFTFFSFSTLHYSVVKHIIISR